jgi:alpha-D-ribose 1-methylphosphonate 5-triphosphate synthase subunit PhnL
MTTPLLQVRDLNKSFFLHMIDGRKIDPIKQVSFDVAPNQHFLIWGRSGVGKTSILKCVYRSYLASSGEIWFDSHQFGKVDLVKSDESTILRLRQHEIGYCSQFLKVLPRVAALDVITEPLMRNGIERQAAYEKGRDWLERLGIKEGLWHASPVTFSGGEQQRINLGRAFIAAPRLLLLDEPTASLDSNSKQIIVDMIDYARANGTAVLTVSHDLDTLAKLADNQLAL